MFKELDERTHELTRSVGELKALGEVSQAVSSTLDLETVLTRIVSHAVQLSGTDGGAIYEYDEPSEEFLLRATDHMEEELITALRANPPHLGDGLVGRAALRGQGETSRGLSNTATRENLGLVSLSNSSRFPDSSGPMLWNPNIQARPWRLKESQAAAGALGLQLQSLEVRGLRISRVHSKPQPTGTRRSVHAERLVFYRHRAAIRTYAAATARPFSRMRRQSGLGAALAADWPVGAAGTAAGRTDGAWPAWKTALFMPTISHRKRIAIIRCQPPIACCTTTSRCRVSRRAMPVTSCCSG